MLKSAKDKSICHWTRCDTSDLLFKDLIKYLQNIQRMMQNGIFATLESCHPPITIPAWMVMMTSKSSGELGVYSWRQHKGFSYNDGWLANSLSIKEHKVWDLLSEQGKKVCLIVSLLAIHQVKSTAV